MKCSNSSKYSIRGFSLLEVVISLFVLSVGFLASIGLATDSIRSSFSQRDSVVASELAQEGLELVYNIRDTNIAKDATDEFAGISNGSFVPQYYVSSSSVALYPASSCSASTGSSCSVYLSGDGFYTQGSGGTSTKFYRRIDISSPDSDTRRITSVVVQAGGVMPGIGSEYSTTCINDNKPADNELFNRCVFLQVQLKKR